MEISGNEIADVVLRQFDAFPTKGKPLNRGAGVKEWVPLSGIVAQGKNSLTCLATATGMKCLPQNRIAQAQGTVLHDWHAEILAIRSFNRFLLDECYALASCQKQTSEFIRLRSPDERTESHFQPFALNDGINLHMYCSEAPCGDASMELTMAAQDDSTPWDLPPSINGVNPTTSPSTDTSPPSDATTHPLLQGRGYFSALGIVRRKPSRPDAPPTLSKSCSDKLALKQSTSLLSSLTSLLISPSNIYLTSLILPSSQHSASACQRAFSPSGRLKELNGKTWDGGYAFTPFSVLTTDREFRFSRRQALSPGEKLVPSNISASWTPLQFETLIGGVLQGRRQHDLKAASRVCKRRMWKLALEIAALVAVPRIERGLRGGMYGDVKGDELLRYRRSVKESVRTGPLQGWVRNVGGEEFGIEGVGI